MQGSSDTDVSELIVAPNSSPFHSVAMTATPVGNVPMIDRKREESIAAPRVGSSLPHHVIAELARVGEIGHPPAVEVVFGHALLGKTLEAVGIAGGLGAERQ